MNTVKANKKSKRPERTQGIRKSAGRTGRIIREIFGGEMIQTGTFRYLPFLIFIAFLAFIYISNNYLAENKAREINKLRKELKELSYEYITTKSKLMNMTKQSQLAEKLQPAGIKESTDPIKTIQITTTGND